MVSSSRLAVGHYNLRRIALDPDRETHGTRIDAVRRGRGRRGAAGLASAIRLKAAGRKAVEVGGSVIEKGSEIGARHPLRRRDGPRARSEELFPDWKALGAPLQDPVSGGPVPSFSPDPARSKCGFSPARMLQEPRQLRRQPRQRVPLARAASRSGGRRDLPRLCRRGVLYDDKGCVRGVATGDMGVGRDGKADPTSISWDPSCAQIRPFRRGLPRPSGQGS